MSFIDSLAKYLQDQGQGTVGTDLFKYRMPPTPDNCTTIYPTGGPEGLRYIGLNYPTVQIRTRHTNPASGYVMLQNIHNVLHGMHATISGGVIITDCFGVQSQPTQIDIDDKGRVHFVINFEFTVNRS